MLIKYENFSQEQIILWSLSLGNFSNCGYYTRKNNFSLEFKSSIKLKKMDVL